MRLDMPIVETKRLLLRPLEEMDACDIFEICTNPNVMKYLTFPPHKSIEQTLYTLRAFWLPYDKRGEPQTWAIHLKDEDKVIGTLEFHSLHEDCAQVGYILHEQYWNQGIMKEALNEFIRVGFTYTGLRRIEALYEKEHMASEALLIACGFQKEGCLRAYTTLSDGKYHDMKIASLLYEEWKGSIAYEKNNGNKI